MELIKNKYMYKGRDLSFTIVRKIARVVSLIAENNGSSFDESYLDFMNSGTYRALQNTRSLMWFENVEFIVDEYFRELESSQTIHCMDKNRIDTKK
ncbi:MAG: hypothetical protein LBT09_00065 [Planctomycetaceae bacterium]|jgi:hypothetical protein|nr:hypothetical protein [Planctomycetaceae bacterium]